MRKGVLLWALFCVLALSGCVTVATRLKTNPTSSKLKLAPKPQVTLATYLRRLGATRVDKQKDWISVTLSSDSLFQPMPDSVKISNRADIDVLADACKKYPHLNIQVNAYTDCIHSEVDNLVLTDLEAWLIKQALVDSGVPADRINAVGWGESWPIATNATAAGRKANRRVRITFKPGKY